MRATSKRSTWIIGTAVLAAVLCAFAWLVVISPVLGQADDTRTRADSTRQQNVVLQAKVTKLKSDAAHLDDYKSALAAISKQIPATVDLAGYIDSISAIATQSGVTVTGVQVQGPVLVTTAASSSAGAATDGSKSTEAPSPAATGSATPSPTPSATSAPKTPTAQHTPTAAASAPAGFTAVPITITVLGTYARTISFLDGVQHTERLFLPTALTATRQDTTAAQGGLPATSVGDLELKVDGYLYVLPASGSGSGPQASAGSSTQPSSPASLPAEVPNKNPLAPVQGAHTPPPLARP